MKFKMVHENYNVADLDRSLAFYEKALGLTEKRRINGEGFIIAYVGNAESDFELELTFVKDHPQNYDLGECEFHLAFRTADFEAAHKLHEEWDVSASKIRRWEFTSLQTLTDTGLRSYRRGKKTGGYPLFMNKRYQIYGRESTGISGLICVEKGIEDCHRYGGNIAEKRML